LIVLSQAKFFVLDFGKSTPLGVFAVPPSLVELKAVAPFEQPPTINPHAWPAFEGMIREVGRSAFRMPTSCAMYLRKHLANFDTERELLLLAMNERVPELILEEVSDGPVEPVLEKLTNTLIKKHNLTPERAKWAVEAWAVSVKRGPGYVPPSQQVDSTPMPAKPPISKTNERLILGGVASIGGAIGGMLGNGAPYLFLYISYFFVDQQFENRTANAKDAFTVALFLIVMSMGLVAGALGTFAGWWMGRGNERPWASAAAGCGSAFGMGCICTLLIGPGLVATIPIFFSAFGATYTSASRGGHNLSGE
jgi:hypothetical protein